MFSRPAVLLLGADVINMKSYDRLGLFTLQVYRSLTSTLTKLNVNFDHAL